MFSVESICLSHFGRFNFLNNVLNLKIKFLSSFLSPHLINFPKDVFQKKIPSCRESPEPLLPLQTQRCDTFRSMQCTLHSGCAPNCPSYLQSLRIKSSGRLVIALGKSSFSMPLRIKLYVII